MDINFEGIEIAPEQKETLLNQVNELVSHKVTDNLNKAFDGVTNEVSSLIGVERLASETKGTDYFKRAIPLYKEQLEKKALEDLNNLKATYESKLKESNLDETIKQENEQLKAKLGELGKLPETYENQLKELKEQHATELFNYKKNNALLSVMPPLDKDANKYEVEARKQAAIKEIEESFKVSFDENGKLVATDENYRVVTVESLLSEKLKDLAPKEIVKGGNAAKGANDKPLSVITFTSEMNTSQKTELVKARLQALGYTTPISKVNGVAYSQMFTQLMTDANNSLK